MPAERVAMGHAREPVRFPAADLDNSSLRSHILIKRCVNIASSFRQTFCVHRNVAVSHGQERAPPFRRLTTT